jgi:hypothetical protein
MAQDSTNGRSLVMAAQGRRFLADAKAHLIFTNSNHLHDVIWRKPDGSFWREQYVRDSDMGLIRYFLHSIDWRKLSRLDKNEIERATPPYEMSYGEL